MNLGMSEMIFIFIAALILVGPKKLPEIMRQVGKFMGEFKRASNEFKYQIESEMRNLELEAERAKPAILPPATATPAQEPPQGTIASGALLEAAPDRRNGSASELTSELASGAPSEPSSEKTSETSLETPAAPERALTSDPESVKSADA